MKRHAFNYAPIRFQPYGEIGEFLNVGVAIHCPQNDRFDFRLVSVKRTGRVKGFFPELDTKIFKAGLEGIERDLELRKVRAQARSLSGQNELAPEGVREQVNWFREFVRRREGLLHFGEPATLIANTPEEALDQLFGRYVERQFAQKRAYHETVMQNRLAQFLRDWKLDHLYERNKKIGDGEFHVVMPFVHFAGDVAGKVVRPLDLNKPESSDIYHHGGTWVKNMERLKLRQQLPPAVVFTVQLPRPGKQLKAASEICSELRQLGVATVDFAEIEAVRKALEVGAAS